MKKINVSILLNLIFMSGCASVMAVTTMINGSGATFPAPLYQRWASEFHKENPSIIVNYQGVGSGAGIMNFTKGLTDFCGSDIAVTDQEIAKLKGNVVMIPLTAGTIVFSYNLPEVPRLALSRDAYAGILLGKITKWNDPIIEHANSGVVLPDLPITVITRSDGSGTTALLTGHLAAMNHEFAEKVGSGKSVKWPVGLAGKGNDGVTALLKQTRGSLGYMEFGFAQNNKLPMVELENKCGEFVAPSLGSGSSALATIQLPDNLRDFAYDPAGQGNYPITGFTWLVLKKEYPAEKGAALKAFVTYTLTTGQQLAPQLGYLPLPAAVVEKSTAVLATVK